MNDRVGTIFEVKSKRKAESSWREEKAMIRTLHRESILAEILRRTLVGVVIFAIPFPALALTPIARTDVVPYQRIEHGTTFKFGVVAFHKEGIRKVDFSIAGQGYSGGTKTAMSMTYNDRTRVYEYWVPISSNEFTSDGIITITPIVVGNDGDTRTLSPTPLNVEANGATNHVAAWVDAANGNDDTGAVNQSDAPFRNLSAAIGAAQVANGGNSDGNIIYLREGTYSFGDGTTTTSDEYLTITRASGADIGNVIISSGGSRRNTNLLHLKGITLLKTINLIINDNVSSELWVDGCKLIGGGRHTMDSDVIRNDGAWYTDVYVYDSYRGIRGSSSGGSSLVRNSTFERIGDDVFQNEPFIINATVSDVDPGDSTYWHSDVFQFWGDGKDNTIVYGLHATDLHYQGMFLRQENLTESHNNAFVNVFIEMREPIRLRYEGGIPPRSSGGITGKYNHLILWHCSFVNKGFSVSSESYGFAFNDVSFVGNTFYQFYDYITGYNNGDTAYFAPGNSYNNVALDNHFEYSCYDQESCNETAPHWSTNSPDSDASGSQSLGDPGLDMNTASAFFGFPQTGSILIDRVSPALVPVDALGNPRNTSADVGALEKASLSAPTGLHIIH